MEKLTATAAKQSIRIALLHFAPRPDDVRHNLDLLESLFLKAVGLQADLILTPELATSGYEFYKALGREWIKSDGQNIIKRFSELARQHKVALVLGSPVYEAQSEKYYNAALFIDEDGQLIGEHHKISVLPGAEEWSSPGLDLKPVAWRGHKIGLLICADAYPEKISAELAKQGSTVLISLAAWAPGLHGPDGEWERRSKQTGLCLFVCNRTGNESLMNFEGSSSVAGVDGRRVVEYSDKHPAILTIDVRAGDWSPKNERFNIFKFNENP